MVRAHSLLPYTTLPGAMVKWKEILILFPHIARLQETLGTGKVEPGFRGEEAKNPDHHQLACV